MFPNKTQHNLQQKQTNNVLMTTDSFLDGLRADLAARGFDICVPFRTGWLHESVDTATHPELRLDPFGRGDAGLGVLIGNTRALWPALTGFLAAHPSWRTRPHPVHDYVEASIHEACTAALPVAADVHFVHETAPGRLVPMQALGEACAFAYYDRTAFLSVHPRFGPWFAYRAAVLLDAPWFGPPDDPQPARPWPARGPTSEEGAMHAQAAMENVWRAVREEQGLESNPAVADVKYHGRKGDWRVWVALRDALAEGIPEAAAFRYPQDQLIYYYTTDRMALRIACGWSDVDVLVVGTQPPCPRCAALDALVVTEASKLNLSRTDADLAALETLQISIRHEAWDSELARGLCGSGSPFASVGTAHQVWDGLQGRILGTVDWDAVKEAAVREDVTLLDALLRPIEAAAKADGTWLMTPVLVVNGRVVWHGSMPDPRVIVDALEEAKEEALQERRAATELQRAAVPDT
jgi:hypothetical protein